MDEFLHSKTGRANIINGARYTAQTLASIYKEINSVLQCTVYWIIIL